VADTVRPARFAQTEFIRKSAQPAFSFLPRPSP
jgi:hypothetical protein